MTTIPGRSYSAADAMAKNLGWFSIALGAAELFAPRQVGRAVGLDGHTALLRGYGLREIVTGIGILSSHDATPFIWGRVVGDVVDLATLAPALADTDGERRTRAGLAAAVVACVAVIDLICARQLSDEKTLPRRPMRDYGDRSGLPQGLEASRGLALAAPSLDEEHPSDAAGESEAAEGEDLSWRPAPSAS